MTALVIIAVLLAGGLLLVSYLQEKPQPELELLSYREGTRVDMVTFAGKTYRVTPHKQLQQQSAERLNHERVYRDRRGRFTKRGAYV